MTPTQLKTIRKRLGKFLNKERERQALTVYMAAKRSDLRDDTVNSIESGEKAYTFDSLLKYCKGLGVTVKTQGRYDTITLESNEKLI